VSKSTNIIEINGKRYDASTGKAISAGSRPVARGSVDGVISHKPVPNVTLATPRTHAAKPLTPLSSTKLMDMKGPMRKPHSLAKAVASHRPQKSASLMRHTVQKPGKSFKSQHPAHGHTDSLVIKPKLAATPKHSVSSVPAARASRAQQIAKSTSITKFVRSSAASAAVAAQVAVRQAVTTPHTPAAVSRPLDIFERAVQQATSHEQPAATYHKHPKRHQILSKRRVSVAATLLTVLLLVGLVGFNNRASLTLSMAANKAGFNANLPAYQPSGYSLGKFDYSAGKVAINFQSNSDQRAFAITEKPSSWNSSTLRDSFVTAADNQYQTVEVGGRTVYLYGNHNAAWVNAGIWYQVQSDGSLSDQQLAKLAASL
jgi:hypothetical protein